MADDQLHVLLVEDHKDQAELVEDILASLKQYRVQMRHEERLSSAKLALRERSFDLILLDLNLPDSRGLPVVREVRANADSAPIIVLTNVQDEAVAGFPVDPPEVPVTTPLELRDILNLCLPTGALDDTGHGQLLRPEVVENLQAHRVAQGPEALSDLVERRVRSEDELMLEQP